MFVFNNTKKSDHLILAVFVAKIAQFEEIYPSLTQLGKDEFERHPPQ